MRCARPPTTCAPRAASPPSPTRPGTSYLAAAESAYATAGAQLTCNLTGAMPLNFAASYSDYHVTGLNPAGNATLTDAAFVAARFRIAQSRRPVA